MKRLTKTLFAFGFTCAITATPLFGQIIYTFDEFGNSTGPGISPGILQPDPSGGVAGNVLIYQLPFAVTTGDVVLSEPGLPAPPPDSDVVRFWTSTANPNQSEIIFYSDFSATDPADAPADVGLPSQLINPAILNEIGAEGNNGAVWNPPAGAPGSIPGAVVQYNIISDGVIPEPGSLALLTSGLGILLGINRFRQKGLSRQGRLEVPGRRNDVF
ncbi:MAG: PEP-CTERM sorting domain-containing protein [Verrucomicrobiota bacterium]|jgi:hypothetical protein